MKHLLLKILFCALLTGVIFGANDFFVQATETVRIDAPFISNISAFSFELGSNDWQEPKKWINNWLFNEPAPFKYRILGKIPIWITFLSTKSLFNSQLEAMYYSYLTWTAIFIGCFLLFSAELSKELVKSMHSKNWADFPSFALSASLLALLPPVLYGFKFPVHNNPNDFLGYALISLCLLSLLKQNNKLFLFFAILGIFCRETNLIVILPLLFLSSLSFNKRALIALTIFSIFITYRLTWHHEYNPLDGAKHNFQYPIEAIAFALMSFSFLWPLSILGLHSLKKAPLIEQPLILALRKTFYPAIVITIIVVWLFARVREIRIEYILFFYIVPFGTIYIQRNIIFWLKALKKPIILLGVTLITATLTFKTYLMLTPVDLQDHSQLIKLLAHFYTEFGQGWVTIFLFYLALSITILSTATANIYLKKQNQANN